MRILATLEYPTGGHAAILGFDVVNHPGKVRGLLGWMPDSFGTYQHMTVVEYLDFYARALGFRGNERVERIAEVMEFTDLTPLADRLTNKLSKGMGQRLCLGRALIHDPDVLIMDEPAAGLDPKARVELKHLIRILAEDGKTILISSHILSELGEMCDSLLFIDRGKLVHHGSAESLKKATDDTTTVAIEVADEPGSLHDWLATSPHAKLLEERKLGARIKIDSQDPHVISGVLKRMITDGIAVTDFHQEERNLEDAFIDILGELDAGTFESEKHTSQARPVLGATAVTSPAMLAEQPPPAAPKKAKKSPEDLAEIPEPDEEPDITPPPPPPGY